MAKPSTTTQVPTTCTACADPNCTSRLNELREFNDWDDLSCHTDEEILVKWVNAYARKELRSKEYHKSYQERNKAFLRYAKEQMDPDEVEALKRQAERKAEGR